MGEGLQVQMRGGDEGGDEAQGDGQPRRRLDLLHHLVRDELHEVGQQRLQPWVVRHGVQRGAAHDFRPGHERVGHLTRVRGRRAAQDSRERRGGAGRGQTFSKKRKSSWETSLEAAASAWTGAAAGM
jgi:hypothetical protein